MIDLGKISILQSFRERVFLILQCVDNRLKSVESLLAYARGLGLELGHALGVLCDQRLEHLTFCSDITGLHICCDSVLDLDGILTETQGGLSLL